MIASRKIAAASEILRLSQSITCFFFLGLSCSWALLSLLLLASGDVFVFLEGVKKINSNTDPHSLSKWFNLIACLNIFSQPIKGQCLHRCCCPGGSALLPLPGNGSCYCQVGAFCCSHNAKVSPSHFSHHCQSFIGERTIKVPFCVHLWHMLIIWDIFHPILWRMKKKAVISVLNGTSKTRKIWKWPKTANFGHVLVYLSN